jgi:hypothetical protein
MLLAQAITVAGWTPHAQRPIDYRHTTIDSLDKVNPRELTSAPPRPRRLSG